MKKIMMFMLLVVGLFFKTGVVHAEGIDIPSRKIWNVYSVKNIFGKNSQGYLNKYTIDGRPAYCVMPGVAFKNGGYSLSSDELLSSDDKEYIELVAYFSTGYTGNADLYYYMAAQQLIWERMGVKDIRWKTGIYSTNYYDITSYIEDIKENVDNYYILPSFVNGTYEGGSGNNIIIDDQNNMIDSFKSINDFGHSITSDNNSLNITFKNNNVGSDVINFRKKLKYSGTTKYYVSENSQSIGSFGISNIPEFEIRLDTIGGYINLSKLDMDTKENKPSGEASFENAVYEVYKGDDLITTLTTNKLGESKSIELPYGEYSIKEKAAPTGYMINNEVYIVNLDKEEIDVEVFDSIIKEEWTLKKYYGSYITNEFNVESNAVFEIYDSKNNLVDTVGTDSKGEVSVELIYGNYIVKQIGGMENFDFVNNFKLNIDGTNIDNDNVVKLYNEKYSVKLKIFKKDGKDDKLIKDKTIFKIKNVDTNEYVMDSDNDYLFETIDGVLKTDIFIEAGNYALEETKAPYGYKLLNESILFSVESKNTIKMEDEDRVMELVVYNSELPKLPDTYSNDYSYIIGLILIVLGFSINLVKLNEF